MCQVLWAVESPLRGYNDLNGGFEELDCIVDQGRQRYGGFSREKVRGVSMPPCHLVSISFLSQTPRSARSLHSSSGLPLIQASFLTGVQRITSISRRVTICDLCCSFVVTGGIHCLTGRVPVGL
jgi:hypothetical protein